MKVKFVIIGGGIAGLCAAIRLAELGEQPLLIEGGSYPAHKICGEFLSPEGLPFLRARNINPVSIPKAIFRTAKNCLEFPFPLPAGAMSHMELDPALAAYASRCGATIKTNTSVIALQPKTNSKDVHRIKLSNDEILEASNVIIATGKIPGYSLHPPSLSYMGFKAHFMNIPSDGSLEMFSLAGAYLGIAPVEDKIFNVACLANLQEVIKWKHPLHFIENLISHHPHLKFILSQGENLFEQWMFAPLPAFGIKQTPNWLDTYFIGDAAVTISPACGDGLSMGILAGQLVAEYAVCQRFQDFKVKWLQRCKSQVFWGRILHKIMLNPSYSNSFIGLSRYSPYLCKKLFEFTRQS